MIRIAVFASGAGSNAQQIINYFNHDSGLSPKTLAGAAKPLDGQDDRDAPVSSPGKLRSEAPQQDHEETLTSGRLPEASGFAYSQRDHEETLTGLSRLPKAKIAVTLIVCNKPGAGVLEIARKENIETLLIEKEPFFRGGAYLAELKGKKIDFIILAGFLWKVPDPLIDAFPRSIINIHPALLPKYGGKGMYGSFVHEAVINAKEQTSGITIHYVDGHYDHGDIIFQANCRVNETDTPQSLAQKIHALEHEHYPRIIEMEINRQLANLADH